MRAQSVGRPTSSTRSKFFGELSFYEGDDAQLPGVSVNGYCCAFIIVGVQLRETGALLGYQLINAQCPRGGTHVQGARGAPL